MNMVITFQSFLKSMRCKGKTTSTLGWHSRKISPFLTNLPVLPCQFSSGSLGCAPAWPCHWKKKKKSHMAAGCLHFPQEFLRIGKNDKDNWPALSTCHSLVEEGSFRSCFTYSLGKAGHIGVKFPEDVCKNNIKLKQSIPPHKGNKEIRGTCATYWAEWSQWWGRHHRRCWIKQIIFPVHLLFSLSMTSVYSSINIPWSLSYLHDSPLYSFNTKRMLFAFAPTPLAAWRRHDTSRLLAT